MAETTHDHSEILALTSDIVAAHVSNNMVAVGDVPQLIENVHGSLAKLHGESKQEEKPEPAVAIRSSVSTRSVGISDSAA